MVIEENGNVSSKESKEKHENDIITTKTRRWVEEKYKRAAVLVFTAGRE